MEKITPVKYINFNSIEVQVIEYDWTTVPEYFKVRLKTLGNPFKYFLGKEVEFKIKDGNLTDGLAKLKSVDTSLEYDVFTFINPNNKSLVDNIRVGTILIINESFSISQDNECVTIQDIHDKIITESHLLDEDYSLPQPIEINGKNGLLTSFDKFKIDNQKVILPLTHIFNTSGLESIIKLKVQPNTINKYRIYFYELKSKLRGSIDVILYDNECADISNIILSNNIDFALKLYEYQDKTNGDLSYYLEFIFGGFDGDTLFYIETLNNDFIISNNLEINTITEIILYNTNNIQIKPEYELITKTFIKQGTII